MERQVLDLAGHVTDLDGQVVDIVGHVPRMDRQVAVMSGEVKLLEGQERSPGPIGDSSSTGRSPSSMPRKFSCRSGR
jgi:hypothetical protein